MLTQAPIFGQARHCTQGNSRMAKGMVMEFGDLGKRITTLMKVSMQRITKMAMECTNGQTEQYIKDLLKMI